MSRNQRFVLIASIVLIVLIFGTSLLLRFSNPAFAKNQDVSVVNSVNHTALLAQVYQAIIPNVTNIQTLLCNESHFLCSFSPPIIPSTTGSIPSLSAMQLSSWVPTTLTTSLTNRGSHSQSGAHASSVGYNEEFMWGYAQTQGMSCADCSTNSPPVPLSTTESYLSALANNGVTTNREIIPVEILTNPAFYPLAATVLKQYQQLNFTVVLALGLPVPVSLSGTASSWCPLTASSTAADTEYYGMSADFAKFMLYLKGRPDINQQWLATHVVIEPFSEFDSLCGYGSTGEQLPANQAGTPQTAARFEGIMQRIFTSAEIQNEITAPSIVNGNYASWLTNYYAAGGSGRPNIHIYPNIVGVSNPVSSAVTQLEQQITAANQVVPSTYRGRMLIGEFGYPDQSAGTSCTPAVAPTIRSQIYTALINDPTINTDVDMFLFWRLLDQNGVAGNTGCDQYYGNVTNAWQNISVTASASQVLATFKQAGLDVFTAISSRLSATQAQTPSCTLRISSGTFTSGKLMATLSWESSHAASASVNNGVGAVSPVATGSVAIQLVPGTISYTMSVQGSGGTASCQANAPTSITPPTTRDAFITYLYECTLMRAPETSVTYWDTVSGWSLSQIYHQFFDSPEYVADGTSDQTFATQMYECLLLRVPPLNDVTHWNGQLGTQASRDAELNNVLSSPEFQNTQGHELQQATGFTL